MKNILAERVTAAIRDVPDFPKPGILFKDITPVLQDGDLFNTVIHYFCERYEDADVTKIVGIESRGFILASAIAHELSTGLVLIRKPGKLPYHRVGVDYDLEYGSDRVEMHVDAINKGERVVLVDDLLATGGTMGAAIELCQSVGGVVHEAGFMIQLDFLDGVKKLHGVPTHSLIHF